MRAPLVTVLLVLAAGEAHADPGANPDLATQHMMLDIASGAHPLARFIDDTSGVVFLDRFEGPEDVQPPPVEKRLCGLALARFVRTWQRRASSDILRSYGDSFLSCQNRPGPPTCTFGRSMEWDPAIHFIFRHSADRGLLLTAITIDDEVLVAASDTAREHRTQARLIARLTQTACPSP
jgi:hypothetical protein